MHIKVLGVTGVSAVAIAEIPEMQHRERMRRDVIVLVSNSGFGFAWFQRVAHLFILRHSVRLAFSMATVSG